MGLLRRVSGQSRAERASVAMRWLAGRRQFRRAIVARPVLVLSDPVTSAPLSGCGF